LLDDINNKSLSEKSPPLNIIMFLSRRDKTNNNDTKVDNGVLYPKRRLKAKIASVCNMKRYLPRI
jgi:hypothetical protein